MKTEQAMQAGTNGRHLDTQYGKGGTTMQATITRTWQSRQAGTILALLFIGALLVGGLVMWNGRSSVGSDVVVPQTSVGNEASGERWVPPQAQAYLPRTMPVLAAERTPADFPPQAQAYLPRSIHDAGKAKAGCEANSFPPQAQAYLPCQRSSR